MNYIVLEIRRGFFFFEINWFMFKFVKKIEVWKVCIRKVIIKFVNVLSDY